MSFLSNFDLNGPAVNLLIGNQAFIGRGVHVATHERVCIGDRVVINDRVTILTASHDVSDPSWGAVRRPVHIESYAWIATGATILPGVTIGRGAVVGAGAVVSKDVPAYSIASGNPATLSKHKRCDVLDYDPVVLAAPVDAWLGRAQ
jgi:maltose O-acetyltransferase